jgi:hypothetical protein
MALALGGCNDEQRSASPSSYVSHGLTVQLPSGWHGTRAILTPNLGDPKQVLAAATYPLRYRSHNCAQVPASALQDLGRTGGFVELEERRPVGPADPSEFPPRPRHFGPGLGTRSEAGQCVPHVHMSERWFGFTDRGRRFYGRVAFGPEASPATQSEAWRILDSLQVRSR